ncbi:MAG: aspartate/glutamate racemase family protein [Acidimicrobiia bacterium]
MHLRAITPIVVPTEELIRRRVRYDDLAPPGVTVHLDNLSDGPDRLESPGQIRRSEQRVYEDALRTDPSRFDGIFLDCVLDPALEQLQVESPLPVFGITRLVSTLLGSLGLRMAAVARNKAIADELADRIDAFGWSSHLEEVLILDLSLEDIGDTGRWNRIVAERVASGDLDGVDAIINGCSAVEVHPTGGPPLLDPTALALRLVGLGADLFDGGRS